MAGTGWSRKVGGEATGTEQTHSGPANRRTATGKPHRPAWAAAKAAAAARDGKPQHRTLPENDRTLARNRQRQAPAARANPATRRQGNATQQRRTGPKGAATRQPRPGPDTNEHNTPGTAEPDIAHPQSRTEPRTRQGGERRPGTPGPRSARRLAAGMRPAVKGAERGERSDRTLDGKGRMKASPCQRAGRGAGAVLNRGWCLIQRGVIGMGSCSGSPRAWLKDRARAMAVRVWNAPGRMDAGLIPWLHSRNRCSLCVGIL